MHSYVRRLGVTHVALIVALLVIAQFRPGSARIRAEDSGKSVGAPTCRGRSQSRSTFTE